MKAKDTQKSFVKILMTLSFLSILINITSIAQAAATIQWNSGNPVQISSRNTNDTVNMNRPDTVLTSDGNYITIYQHSGTYQTLYAQKTNVNGVTQWGPFDNDGGANDLPEDLELTDNVTELILDSMVADGSGGVFFSYTTGDYNTYVNHISSSGTITDQVGTQIFTGSSDATNQRYSSLLYDNAGGVYVTWLDYGAYFVYMTHLNSSLALETNWDGGQTGTFKTRQLLNGYSQLIPSSGTDIIVATVDGLGFDIYKIDEDGGLIWGPTTLSDDIYLYSQTTNWKAVSNGAGGIYISYATEEPSFTYDIRVLEVTTSGSIQGPTILDTVEGPAGGNPEILNSDGSSAIITWREYISGPPEVRTLYAQKVNSSLVTQWNSGNPVAIAADPLDYFSFGSPRSIVSDGVGGAYITFHIDDNGSEEMQAAVQHINDAGVIDFGTEGTGISTLGDGVSSTTINTDNANGAVVTWYGTEGGTYYNVYGQRILSDAIEVPSDTDQTGQIDIECPLSGFATLVSVPSDIQFKDVTSGITAQSSYEDDISNGTPLPSTNLVHINDTKSGGIDGCTGADPGYSGFTLTAQIQSTCADTNTGLCNDARLSSISADDIYLLQTTNFDTSGITSPQTEGDVIMSLTEPTGNDTTSKSVWADSITSSNQFATDSPYLADGSKLSSASIVLETDASWYADIYSGVAVGIIQGIDAYQAEGTYSGTITYTFMDNTAS